MHWPQAPVISFCRPLIQQSIWNVTPPLLSWPCAACPAASFDPFRVHIGQSRELHYTRPAVQAHSVMSLGSALHGNSKGTQRRCGLAAQESRHELSPETDRSTALVSAKASPVVGHMMVNPRTTGTTSP
jgi:hypothetical protein